MYQVVIVGAGHAGVEAAWALKNKNANFVMITFSKNDIGKTHCNVSIGGSAKGILVKELSALGALMPKAADESQTQTKMLNLSKGASVHSIRAQIDKKKYQNWIYEEITKSIEIIESEVVEIEIKNNQVSGVVLKDGRIIKTKAIILTTGVFLSPKTMVGNEITNIGPDNQEGNYTLVNLFKNYKFDLIRLKTGTPPRLKKSTINLNKTILEYGSKTELFFTEGEKIIKKFQNIPAYLIYTNKKTHEIIKKNLKNSYLYSSEIIGLGPKYCPSIEDKIKNYENKKQHQIFLEEEIIGEESIYVAGMSTSLPKAIQEKMIKSIDALKKAEILKYAYSIEYFAINPINLKKNLETKKIKNLFLAGQINGTSGYEEAAGQGLIAGINAWQKINKKKSLILGRNESYLGVMIDDIVTKGIIDPYRLLTSRAEYRILLRTDNATKRLYKIAKRFGLITKEKYEYYKKRFDLQKKIIDFFRKTKLLTNNSKKKDTIFNLLKSPSITINDFLPYITKKFSKEINFLTNIDYETIENEIKYSGYTKKLTTEISQYKKYQKFKLPINFDYNVIHNVSNEAKEKLNKAKPETIAQASSIIGVTPSDILFIISYFKLKFNESNKK